MGDLDSVLMKLRDQFLDDPDDILAEMREAVNDMRHNPGESLDRLMRALHSFKGSAQAVGFQHYAQLLHQVEDVVSTASRRQIEPVLEQIELQVSDLLNLLNTTHEKVLDSGDDQSSEVDPSFHEILGKLKKELEVLELSQNPSSEKDTEPTKQEFDLDDDAGWGMSEDKAEEESQGFGIFDDEPAQEVAKAATEENQGFGIFEDNLPNRKPEPAKAVEEAPKAPVDEAPPSPDAPSSPPAAPSSAPRSPNHALSPSAQYLITVQNEQQYAVPVENVREIIAGKKEKKLPIDRDDVFGVVTVRGVVVPLLNLEKSVFNSGSDVPPETRNCIIVCQQESKLFGITVDDIKQVIRIDSKEMQKTDLTEGGEDNSMVPFIAKVEGQSVLLLNIDKILA